MKREEQEPDDPSPSHGEETESAEVSRNRELGEVERELIERELAHLDDFGTLCFAELERFSCFEAGIFRRRENSRGEISFELICPTPTIITARGYDIDSGEVYLRLLWQSIDGSWHQEFFRQAELYRKSTLLQRLPARGIEITESQASRFIEYLRDYISHFRHKLESCTVVSQQGWKEIKGEKGFVLGSRLLHARGSREVLVLGTNYEQALNQKGSPEGWFGTAEKLLTYPRARFLCYCSTAAPLLRVLGVKSFIVHLFSETSEGKSTLGRLAISLWGNPQELEKTANATSVGIERLASFYNDLPLFLDETSIVDEKAMKTIVYMIANEVGRIRGEKTGGLQKTSTWKTVVISTGETSLKKESSLGGISGRVLELYGGLGAEDAEAVENFNEAASENYGVLGELIIREILNTPEEDLQKLFKTIRRKLRKELKARSGKENRIATIASAVTTAGFIFEKIREEITGKSDNPIETVLEVLREAYKFTSTESYLDNFLNLLRGWVWANRELLEGEYTGKEKPGILTENRLAITSEKFEELCKKWGFDSRRIRLDLLKEGLMEKPNHGLYKRTRIQGYPFSGVILNPDFLNESQQH